MASAAAAGRRWWRKRHDKASGSLSGVEKGQPSAAKSARSGGEAESGSGKKQPHRWLAAAKMASSSMAAKRRIGEKSLALISGVSAASSMA